MFHRIPFFVKICWKCICCVSNFSLRDHWSSIILAGYLSFLQLQVAGFQLYFFCTHDVFFIFALAPTFMVINIFPSFIDIFWFELDFFYHEIHIYICMICVLLMLLIHLFLQSYWKRLDLSHVFCLECLLDEIDH